MRFTTAGIDQQKLGGKLKRARLNLNLGLEEVEKRLKINKKYLEALENEEYEKLPGEIYLKNFLKTYSLFLNLNPQKIIEDYEKEKSFCFSSRSNKKFPQSFIDKISISPQSIRRVIFLVIIFFIIFYLSSEIKRLFLPPFLTIISPDDNIITTESNLKIIGKSEKEAEVKVNDTLVSSNIRGNFEENIELKPGVNLIKISASKRGRERVIYRRIFLITN